MAVPQQYDRFEDSMETDNSTVERFSGHNARVRVHVARSFWCATGRATRRAGVVSAVPGALVGLFVGVLLTRIRGGPNDSSE